MANVLKLSLYTSEPPSGWIYDLYENEEHPDRGWLFYALRGVEEGDVDALVEEFLDGSDDMFEFIKQWLESLHKKKREEGKKAQGVILWFSEGKVHAFPLGGLHVFQNAPHRKRCLTDPIYDFTHYLRWKVFSPGDEKYRVSYSIYPITGEDSFDIMLKDGSKPWRITVDAFQDVWKSGEKKKKKRVSPKIAARKYGHRASVWVTLLLIFFVGVWYIWYHHSLQLNTQKQVEHTSTQTTSSTGSATGSGISFIEPLSLWSLSSLADIATQTYTDVKLPFGTVWDMASVKWTDGTYFIAFTNDVGSALRIAFDISGDIPKYLDKWHKATTISRSAIEGVNWNSPKTFVSPDLAGGKLVLKSTFVNSSWGTFDGLSDAFLDKLRDVSIQAENYDTTIALLTDDKVYLYSGRVGGTFKQLRMPIALPEGYKGERIYLSPAGDVYVLAYRNVREKKKYALVVMRASDDFVPDNLIIEKTEKLLDNLSATFIGAPYLWKEGVVAFPVSGPKDGLALINIVTWKATLIEGRGVIYPLSDDKLGVVFQSFFSLWDLERRD